MAIVPRQSFPWESAQAGDEDEGEAVYTSDAQVGYPRGGPGRYMDVILPPPGFSVWDMPQNKLQTTAVALTFVATAGLVTCLAGAGMLAILVTGFLVSASVLLLVTVCTALVALIVTGVPVGYAAWQLVSRYQNFKIGGTAGSHTGGWEDDGD